MNSYPHLFSPLTIRGKRIRNRIETAPMSVVGSTNGFTREALELYGNMSKGGAGIVTLGEVGVDAETDTCHPTINHLDNTDILPTLTQVVDAIHLYGALASVELNHSGNRSNPKYVAEGYPIYGPSAMTNLYGAQVTEMDEEMMERVCEKFALAASVAEFAGMDIVNVHLGHGWLLAQFLSNLDNHRTDKYGGSIENRCRFPLMVLERIRQRCPKLIIEARMSGDETQDGGITPEEAVEIAKLLDGKVDIIHVSAATFHTTDTTSRMLPTVFTPHACNTDISAAVKKVVKQSCVSVVGGLNEPGMMEDVIAGGKADIVVAGRAFLADPNFANKAREGRTDEIVHCIRCTACMSAGFIPHVPFASGVLRCSVNPCLGREFETTHHVEPPAKLKKVLVAGGGPSGMEAALAAARRGHSVILCEKADHLGAALDYANGISFKDDMLAFRKGMAVNVEKEKNIEVRLNTAVTPELISAEAPDVLIAACGALPVIPPIPGADNAKVHHISALYHEGLKVGKTVAMIGGGQAGCEEALALAAEGHSVTIIEMQPQLAKEAYFIHWKHMLSKIAEQPNIRVLCSARVNRIGDDGVFVTLADGSEETVPADTVLVAAGMRANNAMIDEWAALVPEIRITGDCSRSARIMEAMRTGYCAGHTL